MIPRYLQMRTRAGSRLGSLTRLRECKSFFSGRRLERQRVLIDELDFDRSNVRSVSRR